MLENAVLADIEFRGETNLCWVEGCSSTSPKIPSVVVTIYYLWESIVKIGFPHGQIWISTWLDMAWILRLSKFFRRGQKFNVPMRKMGLSRSSNRFFSSSQIRFVYIIKKPPIPLFPMVKMGMKLGYTLWKTFP